MFRAVLDTCVLFRPLLCDTLLCMAEEELFAPLWSADILDELRRNLLRHGIAEQAVDHRIRQMTTHFPAATVTGTSHSWPRWRPPPPIGMYWLPQSAAELM